MQQMSRRIALVISRNAEVYDGHVREVQLDARLLAALLLAFCTLAAALGWQELVQLLIAQPCHLLPAPL